MSQFQDTREGAGPQFPPPVPTPSPPPRTSGAAVAGLILGILGFFTAGLAAVPGLICSIVAIVKIRKRRRRMGGMGLAIAGLVCSIAAMLMSVVLMGALFWAKGQAKTVVASSHLRSLSLAVFLYTQDYDDQFPSPDTFPEDIAPYRLLRREHGVSCPELVGALQEPGDLLIRSLARSGLEAYFLGACRAGREGESESRQSHVPGVPHGRPGISTSERIQNQARSIVLMS